ncbi:hypothetical protein [Helicobacter mehlei]|uniref:Uncharacterized protein n=1 Tax=Helicobacter mehlei TaxID=2316080 RepID=A0A553UMQ0_9HELI|nr:hypothetical protein [Helicobacter mehlei]TSA81496.1 hypothetical protein FNE76_06585 [Helicobacter mehlei]
MQAPDISAGRGGLSALSDSFSQMQGAHGFMANALNTFHNQVNNIGGSVYNILNNEELKAHKRLQDKTQNERAERALKLQEEGFKYQQMQDKIKNAQMERKINIEAQNVKALNALRGWQGKQMQANTLAQNIQNFNLGGLMQESDNPQTMMGGNAIRAQSGLLKNPGQKPPLITPMGRK